MQTPGPTSVWPSPLTSLDGCGAMGAGLGKRMVDKVDLQATVDACLSNLGSDVGTLLRSRASLGRAGPEGQRARPELAGDALLLEGTLGQGGMGIVHVATQASLGRKVAVKKLRPEHATPEATLKLMREAWVTGSLEHPNIVPVHDVRLDAEQQPQIVLKCIDGVAWSDAMHDARMVRVRFGADDLLEHNLHVLMQVCRAVHFAHTRGIVHRDLKPSNVMIGMHGEVYLLDWGVAVSLREDPNPLAEKSTEVVGTPGYMSPELLRCGAVDPRTDVYLLGATLYEILSGEPPHHGRTPEDVVRSVLESAPVLPDAPAELQAIVQRAMRSSLEDRYDSADQFRQALADFSKHRSAIRLAAEAERRLESLRALIGSDASRHADAYELYGACHFGFREALAIWSECPAAESGAARAVETMIELELEWSSPTAAEALLATLRAPPADLTERVRLAVAAHDKERKRVAALEALGQDRDASRGSRARLFVIAVLGLTWTVAPLATVWSVDPATGRYPPLWLAPLFLIVALGALTLWLRDELRKTAINRGVISTIAVGVIAQLAVAVTAPLLGTDGFHARIYMLLVWSIAIGMAAVTIDRRLAWGGLALLGAFVTTAAYATTIAHVLYAMSLTYCIVWVNAIAIWRRRT